MQKIFDSKVDNILFEKDINARVTNSKFHEYVLYANLLDTKIKQLAMIQVEIT